MFRFTLISSIFFNSAGFSKNNILKMIDSNTFNFVYPDYYSPANNRAIEASFFQQSSNIMIQVLST